MEHMLNSKGGSVQSEEEFVQTCIQDYVVDLKAQVEKRGDDFRVSLSGHNGDIICATSGLRLFAVAEEDQRKFSFGKADRPSWYMMQLIRMSSFKLSRRDNAHRLDCTGDT